MHALILLIRNKILSKSFRCFISHVTTGPGYIWNKTLKELLINLLITTQQKDHEASYTVSKTTKSEKHMQRAVNKTQFHMYHP